MYVCECVSGYVRVRLCENENWKEEAIEHDILIIVYDGESQLVGIERELFLFFGVRFSVIFSV